MPNLNSNHFGVLFTILIKSNNPNISSNTRFCTKKANWSLFQEKIKKNFKFFELNSNCTYLNHELDDLAELFTNNIINAANSAIPKSTIAINAKPWWNEDLKSLRKAMQKLYRKTKASNYVLFKQELSKAKNLYFNSIKLTKL